MEKTTSKMVEEITEKRKMTQDVKNELDKRIFYNFLVAIGIMLYLCAINVTYIYTKIDVSQVALKVFAMISIILTVAVFELAYRKESGKIAITGIEFLIFSIIILYIPTIYGNLDKVYCRELTLVSIFCAIYYVAKAIAIYMKTEKEYKSNLSDVKEIRQEKIDE